MPKKKQEPDVKNPIDPKKIEEFVQLQEEVQKLQRELKRLKPIRDRVESELIEEMEGIGQTVLEIGDVVLRVTSAKKVAVKYGKLFELALSKVNKRIHKYLLEAKETMTTIRIVKHLEIDRKSSRMAWLLRNRIAMDANKKGGVQELWAKFKAKLKSFRALRSALEKFLEHLRELASKMTKEA